MIDAQFLIQLHSEICDLVTKKHEEVLTVTSELERHAILSQCQGIIEAATIVWLRASLLIREERFSDGLKRKEG